MIVAVVALLCLERKAVMKSPAHHADSDFVTYVEDPGWEPMVSKTSADTTAVGTYQMGFQEQPGS